MSKLLPRVLPLAVAAVFALAFARPPRPRAVPVSVPAVSFRRLHAPSMN